MYCTDTLTYSMFSCSHALQNWGNENICMYVCMYVCNKAVSGVTRIGMQNTFFSLLIGIKIHDCVMFQGLQRNHLFHCWERQSWIKCRQARRQAWNKSFWDLHDYIWQCQGKLLHILLPNIVTPNISYHCCTLYTIIPDQCSSEV